MGVGAIGCFGPIQTNKQSNLEGIMSKFKGTPGMWQPVFNRDFADGSNVSSIYSEDGIYVADVYRGYVGSEDLTEVEQKANARLIAAAPELLDAAIMAVEHYDEFFKGVEPPEDLPWVPVMREAIKEALGEDME